MLRYTVLLRKNTEVPGYSVIVPELPGCFSQGATLEEALSNAKEAIECHLEAMIQDGAEIPVEEEPFVVATVVAHVSLPKEKGNGRITFVIEGHEVTLTRQDIIKVVLGAQKEAPNLRRYPEVPYHYVEVAERRFPARWLFVRVLEEVLGLRGLTQTNTHRARRVFARLDFAVGENRW